MDDFCRFWCPLQNTELCALPSSAERIRLTVREIGFRVLEGFTQSGAAERCTPPPPDVHGMINETKVDKAAAFLPSQACAYLHKVNLGLAEDSA